VCVRARLGFFKLPVHWNGRESDLCGGREKILTLGERSGS
jgi:hypothetical protein